VSFFAYPGKASDLVPHGCQVHTLAAAHEDVPASVQRLLQATGAQQAQPPLQPAHRPGRPQGKFTADKVCKAIAHLLPEGAIVVDEAQTSGLLLAQLTAGSPRHDVLTLTGGAIGQALPCAVGAAVACPERKVLALSGDGSAMYTLQALWTMARERLDVVTVIFNNRSYAILNVELQRVGAAGAGEKARGQLDLGAPALDFVRLRHLHRGLHLRAGARAAHARPAPDRGRGAAHAHRPEAARAAAPAGHAGPPARAAGARAQAPHRALSARPGHAMAGDGGCSCSGSCGCG